MESVIKFVGSYDSFNYGEKSKPMTLQEAAMEAGRLAAHDSSHFYRVVPVDEALSGFRIEKVSKQKEWLRSKFNRSSSRTFEHTPYSYTYRHR